PEFTSILPSPPEITMSLLTYKQKRDFSKTLEPKAKIRRRHGKPIFVIQEHHARRLHWDFRLEAGGLLKSWAVTREPTTDPESRRLAVPTEDHPLEYAKFKGEIPEGQYGAGHVSIWDHGTYDVSGTKEPEKAIVKGVERGNFNFNLHGRKLQGEFALVRMNSGEMKGNWLLIKKHDKYAGRGIAPKSRANGRHRANAKAISRGKPGEIKFTHLEKVLFPEMGVTKGDLIDYYRKVSRLLLPHLRNRPVTLERLPDGLAGKNSPHFWQKNTPDYYPAW